MKTFLKVLGYISAFIAVFGGFKVMVRENFASYSVAAFLIYVAISALCFWGSSKIKK
jgi:flagellar motor component MotA